MRNLEKFMVKNFSDLALATSGNLVDDNIELVIYNKETGNIVNQFPKENLKYLEEMNERDKTYFIRGEVRTSNVRNLNTFQEKMKKLDKVENVENSIETIFKQFSHLNNENITEDNVKVVLRELTRICNNKDWKLIDIANEIV